MNNIDSARTSGQISSTSEQVQSETEETSPSSNQPGFVLKIVSKDHSAELVARGTVVTLALIALLTLTGIAAWHRLQLSSNSPQAEQTTRNQR